MAGQERIILFNLLPVLGLLLLSALGCGHTMTPTSTPPPVLADSFYYGRAYVDANGNGQVDEGDPPLEGVILIATDAEGLSGSGRTDAEGLATAWWPAGSTYPITLRMKPPERYILVGPEEVVLQEGEYYVADFLFVPAATPEPFDEVAFWEKFPLPDDAEIAPVVEGFDLGFATGLTEPQVFDFYAAWLREEGWRQQAPTEAMVTLPHEVWRKGEAELRIEIEGLDERGRTVVWVQVAKRTE